jgi:hypothetical protein
MLSICLCRWYINIAITILDIIHRPVFYLKDDVSETGFCLCLQLEPVQVGQYKNQSLSPEPPENISPEYGNIIQSPKFCDLNKRQDDG